MPKDAEETLSRVPHGYTSIWVQTQNSLFLSI
jgi:hypothetical protein